MRIGESDDDQIVEAWITRHQDAGRSASDEIKRLIVADWRAANVTNQELKQELIELRELLMSGRVLISNGGGEPQPVEDGAFSAFKNMPT